MGAEKILKEDGKGATGRQVLRLLQASDQRHAVVQSPCCEATSWRARTDAAANLEIYHLRCPRDVQFAYADDAQPGA